jgi:2-methylisocitrate lyase-like PEP mutase family enzyme
MISQADKAARFHALHVPGTPLLLPNPWDAGSARLLASLGFEALATTSSGFAATLGRLDGTVTRDEAIAHSRVVVDAVDVPVSADLEQGFADDPAGVAATMTAAVGSGLAGGSVEDWSGGVEGRIYDIDLAAERVAAAVEAAHAGPAHFVVTARAENYLRGFRELTPTIERLQRYQEAGADALYAPGLNDLDEIRQLVDAVDRPVNVLALPGGPTVEQLASVGVARISVGGAFAMAALSAVVDAANELRQQGTFGYWDRISPNAAAIRAAFTD